MEAEALYRPFSTLSNGERTKVLLAALLSGEERYLLIDEPTNHLDAQGRRAVAEYLRRKRGFCWCLMTGPFWTGAWTM